MAVGDFWVRFPSLLPGHATGLGLDLADPDTVALVRHCHDETRARLGEEAAEAAAWERERARNARKRRA